jgi:hypothetical protein
MAEDENNIGDIDDEIIAAEAAYHDMIARGGEEEMYEEPVGGLTEDDAFVLAAAQMHEEGGELYRSSTSNTTTRSSSTTSNTESVDGAGMHSHGSSSDDDMFVIADSLRMERGSTSESDYGGEVGANVQLEHDSLYPYSHHHHHANPHVTTVYDGANHQVPPRRQRRSKGVAPVDTMLEQMDSDSDQNMWGLPGPVRNVYAERGIRDWFPWQLELLNNPLIMNVRRHLL